MRKAAALADMVRCPPSLHTLQVCFAQDMVGLGSFAPHIVCNEASGLVV